MDGLFAGLAALRWDQAVMMAIGGLLIWLAIKKEYEPGLLLPIGFGAILANIPFSAALDHVVDGVQVEGALSHLFRRFFDPVRHCDCTAHRLPHQACR